MICLYLGGLHAGSDRKRTSDSPKLKEKRCAFRVYNELKWISPGRMRKEKPDRDWGPSVLTGIEGVYEYLHRQLAL